MMDFSQYPYILGLLGDEENRIALIKRLTTSGPRD
jgi:hypothetical protein